MTSYLISIIIPVLNEAVQIEKTIKHTFEILNSNNIPHQFIIVDDGSTDDTFNIIKGLNHYPITAIKLSRNFGKEGAISAGIDYAKGDAIVVMDSDLQHPPSLIPQMVKVWHNDGFEIVEAVKSNRGKESMKTRIGAAVFYSLLEKMSGINLKNASDFKLLDRKVVNSWQSFGERNTFFRALSVWGGYKRHSIPFSVPEREAGNSKWTTLKLARLAINAITSFSSLPLQLFSIMGFIMFLTSVVIGVQTLVMKLSGKAASGFTTVILLQLLIGSCLMISLGIIGTYIAKIFDEVKARPRYIISEKYDTYDIDKK